MVQAASKFICIFHCFPAAAAAAAGTRDAKRAGEGRHDDSASCSFQDHAAFRDAMDDLGLLVGLGQQEVLTLVREASGFLSVKGKIFPLVYSPRSICARSETSVAMKYESDGSMITRPVTASGVCVALTGKGRRYEGEGRCMLLYCGIIPVLEHSFLKYDVGTTYVCPGDIKLNAGPRPSHRRFEPLPASEARGSSGRTCATGYPRWPLPPLQRRPKLGGKGDIQGRRSQRQRTTLRQ